MRRHAIRRCCRRRTSHLATRRGGRPIIPRGPPFGHLILVPRKKALAEQKNTTFLPRFIGQEHRRKTIGAVITLIPPLPSDKPCKVFVYAVLDGVRSLFPRRSTAPSRSHSFRPLLKRDSSQLGLRNAIRLKSNVEHKGTLLL